MKRCPVCKTLYPADANFCPMDASQLIDVTTPVKAAPSLELPTMLERVIGGRYQLGPQLGGHRSGAIHAATDGFSGQQVAVKLISPRVFPTPLISQRTERELKQLQKVVSDRVIKVLEVGKQADQLWVATEMVSGNTLAEVVDKGGPVPLAKALRYTLEIGEALAEAAKLGVIHRDVSPKNVLVIDDKHVKVLNFGIPTPGEGSAGRAPLFGVPEFLSPEQAEGKPVDQRSNIYSLGMLLYYMVVGAPPFRGSVDEVLKQQTQRVPPPPPSGLPPEIERVLMKALEKSSSRRHLTLRQLLGELDALLPLVAQHQAARLPSEKPKPVEKIVPPAPVLPPAAPVVPPDRGGAANPMQKTLMGVPFERTSRPQAVIVPEPVEEQVMARGPTQPARQAGAPAPAPPPPAPPPPTASVSTGASGSRPRGKGPASGRKRKGKFRETMWFKKGELDQAAAAQAATHKGKPDELPVSDKADEMGIDERYKDDGSITAADHDRLSLRTGGTQVSLPAVTKAAVLPGERMADRELLDEVENRWPRLAAIIAAAVLVCALIVYFAVLRK